MLQCNKRFVGRNRGFESPAGVRLPATRDTAATAIDQALSSQHFLTLADGTTGRLTYVGTTVFDQSQNARLYRRDLNYNVEYATVVSNTLPAMLFGNLVLNSVSITA